MNVRLVGRRWGSAAIGGSALALALALAGPAEAHRLKLFATVEDGAIGGYAFFVGGGRPEGVDFIVKDGAGREVHRGKTDDQGRFRWRPEAAADYAVTVDAGDGHWAEGSIAADRLATLVPTSGAAAPVVASEPTAPTGLPATAPTALACPAPIDPTAFARLVEARVDEAVARQLRPLIESYEHAEGRLRFNDVMGGIGMIVGLAGAGLWATARRRKGEPT